MMYGELLSLLQWGLVANYQCRFEKSLASLLDLSNGALKKAFVNGLRDDIQAEIQVMVPANLC